MSFSFSEEFWLTSLSQFQQICAEKGTTRNDIPGAWGVYDLQPGGFVHVNTEFLPLDRLSSFILNVKIKPSQPLDVNENKKIFIGLLGESIINIDESKSAGFVYDFSEDLIYLAGTNFTTDQSLIDNPLFPNIPKYVISSSVKYPSKTLLRVPMNFWNFTIEKKNGLLIFSIDGKTLANVNYNQVLGGKTKLVIGCKTENCGAYLDKISFEGKI